MHSRIPSLLLATTALLAVAAAPASPTSSTSGPDVPTVYDADADGVEDGADGVPAPAYDDWTWADAATAPIHPGVQTVTLGSQCTANFVFVRTTEVDGVEYLVDVLLGTAAHCISERSGSDECQDVGDPIGTPTEVDGATQPAAAAYNATISMQAVGETDPDTCRHNDLGMIRLHHDDWDRVNPSVPDLGGPVGVNSEGVAAFDDVYSWGNSSLRAGVEQTSPKRGVALGSSPSGWNHSVYTVTPGIFGDSGSGFIDADGHAFGVLSTLLLAPPGANNADDLHRTLTWARANEPTMTGLRLEPGTEPFDPSGYPFLP